MPIFATHAQAYHTEVALTQAVVRELNTRTRYRVLTGDTSQSDADAVLSGTVLTQTSVPLTYDSTTGETSSYLVTISVKVSLTAHDGRVLYQNDALSFREQYQSTQDLSGFIREDPAGGATAGTRFRASTGRRYAGVVLMASLKSFASTDRFLAEIASPSSLSRAMSCWAMRRSCTSAAARACWRR